MLLRLPSISVSVLRIRIGVPFTGGVDMYL